MPFVAHRRVNTLISPRRARSTVTRMCVFRPQACEHLSQAQARTLSDTAGGAIDAILDSLEDLAVGSTRTSSPSLGAYEGAGAGRRSSFVVISLCYLTSRSCAAVVR